MAEKKVSLLREPKSSGSATRLLWLTESTRRLGRRGMQLGRVERLLKLRSRWVRHLRLPTSGGKLVREPC